MIPASIARRYSKLRHDHRLLPVDILQKQFYAPTCWRSTGETMGESKGEILQGTLDLMVLKVLEGLGPMHGYGIARRLEQVSENLLQMNQGTLYPALLRLQQQGWITSKWGASENNRRAKFYSLTPAGRKQLAAEEKSWERTAALMARLLAGTEEA
jgi:PadR family transcriptional regulator, regulatory protein PadR